MTKLSEDALDSIMGSMEVLKAVSVCFYSFGSD